MKTRLCKLMALAVSVCLLLSATMPAAAYTGPEEASGRRTDQIAGSSFAKRGAVNRGSAGVDASQPFDAGNSLLAGDNAGVDGGTVELSDGETVDYGGVTLGNGGVGTALYITVRFRDGEDVIAVEVPIGGVFTVKTGAKTSTYLNPDDGMTALALEVDGSGRVTIREGSVTLSRDDSVVFGDTGITGTGDQNVNVTVSAVGSGENAEVWVSGGLDQFVIIGEREYRNGDFESLFLEVTPLGEVWLAEGAVILPDDLTPVYVAANEGGVREYEVTGEGVTVNAYNTTPVARTAKGGSFTVNSGRGQFTTYTAPDTMAAGVKLTEAGPVLYYGAVCLDEGESIGVYSAFVEAAGDESGGKKVTVTVDSKTNEAAVDIPEGGGARVNGVEIGSPAKVRIDKTGTATVTPVTEGGSVKVGGVLYTEKDESAAAAGKVIITPSGDLTYENMTRSVPVPTAGPVYVSPKSELSFEVDGKKTTLTGGEHGGYIAVDDDGAVTVTDETGSAEYGTYKNAGDFAGELKLEIDGQRAALTGGAVYVDGYDTVMAGGTPYTAGMGGAILAYSGDAGEPTLKGGSVVFSEETGGGIRVGTSGGILTGKYVEIFADAWKAGVTGKDGKPAVKGQMPNGGTVYIGERRYFVPAGETAVYEDGRLGAPAAAECDGPVGRDGGRYVLVPDSGNGGDKKIFDVTADSQMAEMKSALLIGRGAAFDVREKGEDGSVSTPKGGVTGHYEAVADGTRVTVDHMTGEVTLAYGSLKVSGREGKEAAVRVGEREVRCGGGDILTVTVPASQGGNNAKVEVEKGGRAVVDGKEYENVTESGSGQLTLEIDPMGGVILVGGTVRVRGSVTVNGNTVNGEGVTVEREVGAARVTVPGNGKVTVKNKSGMSNAYQNSNDTEVLELELTEEGTILSKGSVEVKSASALRVDNALLENNGNTGVTVTREQSDVNGATVEIPVGGGARVNGVAVRGRAKIEIDKTGTAAVMPYPAGNGRSVTVGGVTYTDTSENGAGTVTVGNDGKLNASDDMTGRLEMIPAEGLRIGQGDTFTYTASKGRDVTVTGSLGGADMDIDAKGDITMIEGRATVKGDVAASYSEKAGLDTKAVFIGDVTIAVTDEDGRPVEGAGITVKVQNSGDTYARKTDKKGQVTFLDVLYGIYSVTVQKEGVNGKPYNAEGIVTVDAPEVSGGSETFVLSELSLKTTVESDLKGAVPFLAVDDIKAFITDYEKAAAQNGDMVIDITLRANDLGGRKSQLSGADVEEITSSLETVARTIPGVKNAQAITDMIDVTVTRTVTGTAASGAAHTKENTMPTTPALLTLTFPLTQALKNKIQATPDATKENIFVLRQHGANDNVQMMCKVSPSVGRTAGFECYYVQELNDAAYIVIRADQFSVYAFGVAGEPIEAQDSVCGITVRASDHGIVNASSSWAAPGVEVTLTVEPDEGYELEELTVTESGGREVAVTDNGDGTYSFTRPADSVTVKAGFRLKTCDGGADCHSRGFPDLEVTAWYHQYTDYVVSRGLMRGNNLGLFDPSGTVTRATVVMTLWNYENKPVVNYATRFTDVRDGQWYTEAIRWAAREGIVGGYDDGTFRPDRAVNREELAAMIYRYEQYRGGGFTGDWMYRLTFTDSGRVSGWAYEAVGWCCMNKVIQGKGGNVFDPAGTAKRNDLAAILTRYLQLAGDAE